jgi:hypothetical protein
MLHFGQSDGSLPVNNHITSEACNPSSVDRQVVVCISEKHKSSCDFPFTIIHNPMIADSHSMGIITQIPNQGGRGS